MINEITIPIDPMDGLPDVPLMVERGMPIHEALAIWGDAKWATPKKKEQPPKLRLVR